MSNLKTSLQIVGNYMCKNPPVILLDVTDRNNERQIIKRYLFNTPPDIQRHFQSQFVKIYGFETIMYTSFSHEVLAGMVNLVIALYDYQKMKNIMRLQFYGTEKHWDYFQTARFHLGEKVFGTSYSTWLKPALHRMGIIDQTLYEEIQTSQNFSSFVMRINWRIQNEPKQKINDSREHLKDKNEYYQDEYILIKPFFETDPSVELKKYYGSSTHFFCVCKQQNSELFSQGKDQSKSMDAVQKATLIITYQSVEQMGKILDRTDGVKGVNNRVGLLDFIQWNIKNHSPRSSGTRLQTIVHIISSPQLILTNEFHRLFSSLDNLCYPSCTPAQHLFYGYGIKSPKTSIHHLLNSYYKGIRFYSICSKLSRYIPNITLNHLSYWSKVFDREFVNLEEVVGMMEGGKRSRSLVEIYKPVHRVVVGEDREQYDKEEGKTQLKDQSFYAVSAQLLAELKYPLFDTATDYRISEQLRKIYEKKAAFEKLTVKKAKNIKSILTPKAKLIKEFDPKIIFLGTNSKTPSQLRNVSGILLEIPHDSSQSLILMDCGQGTYQQFVYHYAPEELDKKLLALKVIFMTHLHGDHNLGVTDLIKKRNDLIKKKGLVNDEHKLFLVLPFNALAWFWGYCKNVVNINEGCEVLLIETLTGEKINLKDDFFQTKRCEFNIQRVKLSRGKMFANKKSPEQVRSYQSGDYYQRYIKRFGSFEEYIKTSPEGETGALKEIIYAHTFKQEFLKEMFDRLIREMKIKKFKPSKVFHCPFSYGLVIEHNNGIKVSYSGDCRPTPEFLEEAKNSTLLIHEATYETNREEKALQRLHSTFHEAIEAGIISNSDHVCVTHFTPAPFDRDIAETLHRSLYKPETFEFYQKKSIIACDHLSFKLSDLEEVVKVSKIISHIGTNSVTQKDINPFTVKFMYQKLRKGDQKEGQDEEQNEN